MKFNGISIKIAEDRQTPETENFRFKNPAFDYFDDMLDRKDLDFYYSVASSMLEYYKGDIRIEETYTEEDLEFVNNEMSEVENKIKYIENKKVSKNLEDLKEETLKKFKELKNIINDKKIEIKRELGN